MPRPLRIHYPGAYYHVMLRGNCRERIFFSDKDRLYFLKLFQESIQKYKAVVYAYCLMENHVHLLIQVNEIPLSKIMHNLNFRYANYINFQFERVGHLFQGRYKAILIEDDDYLKELVRYIHLNPIKAKMVLDLSDYIWSSHNCYIGIVETSWLNKELLHYFGNENDCIKFYESYINEKVADLLISGLSSTLQAEFDKLVHDVNLCTIALSRNKVNSPLHSLESLANYICKYYSLPSQEIFGKSRSKKCVEVRTAIAYLAIYFEITSQSEVAKFLNRNKATLSSVLKNSVVPISICKLKEELMNEIV